MSTQPVVAREWALTYLGDDECKLTPQELVHLVGMLEKYAAEQTAAKEMEMITGEIINVPGARIFKQARMAQIDGAITVYWTSPMSPESVADAIDFLALVTRQIKRESDQLIKEEHLSPTPQVGSL